MVAAVPVIEWLPALARGLVFMCRIAAYLGSGVRLDRFLLEPEHSLYRQSWQCREMREAVVNADGYGLGFLGESGEALVYKCTAPIWADPNLAALGVTLHSRLWVGNVRSATPGQATSMQNTQPYVHAGRFFLHNGYLDDFDNGLRGRFIQQLAAEWVAEVQGNTDSEYLYAWIRQHADVQSALAALPGLLGEHKALLNMVVADATGLLVCRHALHAPCPSLYYCTSHERYPHAVLVASECFDDSDAWLPVPEHQLLWLRPGQPPQQWSL